jgi:hypothetical protein
LKAFSNEFTALAKPLFSQAFSISQVTLFDIVRIGFERKLLQQILLWNKNDFCLSSCPVVPACFYLLNGEVIE